MVEEIKLFQCGECCNQTFQSKEEAEAHELENLKCYYCGTPVEVHDWSKGNIVICPNCQPKWDKECEEGLGSLFGGDDEEGDS